MGKLYIGKKRIRKAYMKVRANTDFITATSSDILSGKTTIDKNYNKITGSMPVLTSSDLATATSSATAVASDITLNKTGYKNGTKIIGTAIRSTPKNIINGNIESYQVANNNVINSGDFIKFVTEECGCGYESTEMQSTHTRIAFDDLTFAVSHAISVNKVLLFYTRNEQYSYVAVLNTENGTTTILDSRRIVSETRISSSGSKIIPISNNRFVLLANLGGPQVTVFIVSINDSYTINNVTTIDTEFYNYYYSTVKLNDDRIFVTYPGTQDMISCSIFTINSNNTINITNLTLDTETYARNVKTTLVSSNKILVIREDLIGDGPGSMFTLDISDLNLIQVGLSQQLTANQPIWLSATDVITVSDNIAILCHYLGYSGSGVTYISIVYTDGLRPSVGRSFTINDMDIDPSSCIITKISENILGISQGSNSGVWITPIFLTDDIQNSTAGTSLRLHRESCMYVAACSPELNKLHFIYQQYNASIDREIRAKLFEVRLRAFTEILTVYTDVPLTKTMVALATGNDTIGGIADTFGVGALYGGDTIDVIVPNI